MLAGQGPVVLIQPNPILLYGYGRVSTGACLRSAKQPARDTGRKSGEEGFGQSEKRVGRPSVADAAAKGAEATGQSSRSQP